MAKNEADIIETFCRYYAQFTDGIIITNHRSVDDTSVIIGELIKEGLPIRVRDYNAVTCDQATVMTGMMKEAVKDFGAHWVLLLDADEFLSSVNGSSVRDVLGNISRETYLRVPWRTYIPVKDEDDSIDLNLLQRVIHRLKEEYAPNYKVVVPDQLAGKWKHYLSYGNHWLLRRPRKRKVRDFIVPEDLVLGHFPVRSKRQLMSKVYGGWLSQLSSPERSGDQTGHWRNLFRRFLLEDRVKDESVRDLAIGYLIHSREEKEKVELVEEAISPPTGDFTLLYNLQSDCDPLKILADTAEEIAMEMADMRAKETDKFRTFKG